MLFKTFYENLILRRPVEEALADAQRRVFLSNDSREGPSTITPLWAGFQLVSNSTDVRLERRENMLGRIAIRILESVKDVPFPGAEDGATGRKYGDYLNGVGTLYNVVNEAFKRTQQVGGK